MTTSAQQSDVTPQSTEEANLTTEEGDRTQTKVPRWRRFLGGKSAAPQETASSATSVEDGYHDIKSKPEKWSLGVLNDRQTDEVPGTLQAHFLLLYCDEAGAQGR